MKKIVLISLFAMMYVYGNAQSFTLVNPTTQIASDISQLAYTNITIHNGSASPKDVMVQRTLNILATGHVSFFCWDTSYPASVDSSVNPLTIQPNADNTNFYGYIDPNGIAGLDTVCYKFFDVNNASDYVDICLYFDISTGIPSVGASQKNPLSVASPNPANTLSGINYYTDITKNPELVIYDLLGAKVFETRLMQKQGAYIINVADFKQGIYLCSLIENKKNYSN